MDKQEKDRINQKKLLWLSGFIGLGAYLGTIMFFISPDGSMWGMSPILPLMQNLPFADIFFQNFIFSGILLSLVIGVPNTACVWLTHKKSKYGIPLGLWSGLFLLAWLCVQWAIFDLNILTSVYTFFSVLQISLAISILKKEEA